eukprot:CAMPEP_0174932430 /NCGR_PEP_ID=MMETSP1355-20121228/35698_1 /TAXON_ID=464990 /ORGANISM="Hemiselmis tepida, Strain CCMP443" /LENGTH=103 /DNA_ID=CAMNT_0016178843 /DNA_START=288 /DNA_END=595 /DNA_ORIENTATION=+
MQHATTGALARIRAAASALARPARQRTFGALPGRLGPCAHPPPEGALRIGAAAVSGLRSMRPPPPAPKRRAAPLTRARELAWGEAGRESHSGEEAGEGGGGGR